MTDQFAAWYGELDDDTRDSVTAAVDMLQENGPNLKRPTVGAIKGSKHDPQMKELRAQGGTRVLFIFDPRRTAILLIGGDKQGEWNRWYGPAIKAADKLYEDYLRELREEGVLKDG